MSRLFRAALAALSVAAVLGLPATARAADPPRIAIIVGPVGSLTPTYLALAERAAATAERHGAIVARAYSPHATPGNVLAAVADANVVIYFGHGYGSPSPYGGLNTAKQNGWALQGPSARGTHGDAGGQVGYYGEDWIVANARPAPGFVMIYSNTCYAPGASEGGHPPATALQAAQRVAHYSRSTFTLGGSAYFATDFDHGAADLLDRLLGNRGGTFGTAFVSDPRYVPSGLTTQGHHFSAGQQIWLHRSKYTDGPPNYWYAFAGNPDLSLRRAWDRVAPAITLEAPLAGGADVAPGASIALRVSERVNGITPTTVRLTDAAGAAVPTTVAYDADTGEIRVRPGAPLRLSDRYEVVVAAGISDEAGNAMAPASWGFRTRLDADPLVEALPVVLETGSHELLLGADDGSRTDTRTLELSDARWLTAANRARLEGRAGTWLQLAGAGLDGWWVAESGQAHAVGITEEAILDPGTTVTLPARPHIVSTLADGGMQPLTELAQQSARQVEVDRRIVAEGRTYVRLGPTESGAVGAWLEVGPGVAPPEASAQHLLGREVRGSAAMLSLSVGDGPVFRFDERGRVIERRTISGAEAQGLATNETLLVGGKQFFVVTGGELHGWAVADDPRLTAVQSQPAPAARD